MKFNEFVNNVKSTGGVDTDGYYGKQCMDLYNYYCNNVLGLQNVGASCAKEILNNPNIMNNVERIDNYLEFVPQKGDIAIWTAGEYGHVAICLGEGDINTFKSLDQNWKPQQLTEEIHNYTYMAPLVFLRPKNQSNIVEEQPKQPTEYAHKAGEIVVYSSCYRGNNDVPPNYIDCIKEYGAWQQRCIKEVVGGKNPYKLDNGLFVNDGDIRELK